MGENDQSRMATGRALTTDTEREYLRGKHGKQRMYEARSRIKRRIRDRLTEDVESFRGDHPELLDELREVVCGPEAADTDADRLREELAECREQLAEAREQATTTDGGTPGEVRDHLARGLDELPPSVPGRTAVEDALAELDRAAE